MNESTSSMSGLRNWKTVAMATAAAAFVFLAYQYANALSYSAEPITATVVDAESRQPLEGVNVLVLWDLEDQNGRGGEHWKFEEAVTDKEGRFHFPGWGPKSVPRTLASPAWRLGSEQPVIHFFKSGYSADVVRNPWESSTLGDRLWTGNPVRLSAWSGKKMELRRFVGEEQDYLIHLSLFAGRLPLQGCRWAKIPRFTASLLLERGDRIKPPMTSSLPTINDLEEQAKSEKDCVAPAVVLSPYLK